MEVEVLQGRSMDKEGLRKESGRIQEGFKKDKKRIGTSGRSWRTKGLPPSRYLSCIVR